MAMARIAYVNGRYVPHGDAAIHIEDRGYQFADGVYEVVTVFGRRLVDETPHLDRLDRSLGELRIAAPMSRAALRHVMHETIRRNRLVDGLLYIQVTRGVAPRNHMFPGPDVTPSVVMTARPVSFGHGTDPGDGVRVVTIPDMRWARRDIKSVSLLPNVLGKQQAAEAGAFEAWMVDADGNVTEGTSSNAWIVTADNCLVTRPTGNDILTGITRQAILAVAGEAGIVLEERPFSVDEAKTAREAFLSSATSFVKPVTQIDECVIANGEPGSLTRALYAHYMKRMESMPLIA
jgi:D-alanine transaminase